MAEVDPRVLDIIENCAHVDSSSQAFADDSQVVIVSESLLSCQLIANDVLGKLHTQSKIKSLSIARKKRRQSYL